MRRLLCNSERLGWIALWLVVVTAGGARAATPAAPAAAGEPAQWLERMNKALTSRNYDGTFSRWHGGRVEMLRIIHRVQDGAVSERLVSLDGSGREFIRTGGDLTCYLPDKRIVLVEHGPAEESLFGSELPALNAETAKSYDISEVARTRLNRRDTRVIMVAPKDEFRYGYRLWIDESTAMPLKTQLCDAHGHVIEQTVFANLTLSPHIPDSAFKPDVSTTGFQWLRNDSSASKERVGSTLLAWSALKLPPGFRMTVHSAQVLPGSTDPVDHWVISDGIASISVFVEEHPVSGPQSVNEEEAASVGSSSAFSTVVDGHKVTAVGEVPLATVRFIANSVKAQGMITALPGPTVSGGPRH
jgi:sigma-E factor negative regulatory protein RseB